MHGRMIERIRSKQWLYTELLVLTIGMPALLYWLLPPRMILPLIWGASFYCLWIYWKIEQIPFRIHWGVDALTLENMLPLIKRFLISASALTVLTLIFTPHLAFSFVLNNFPVWVVVMVAYPLLSVVPQEIIFRVFFFSRYSAIFTRNRAMIIASGITFGLAHLVFHNWVAPVLCAIGGLMFAQTYDRSRSLLLVSIEHAIYGNFLFTVGLGHYFYHGSVVAAAS
jgi:hypothetical protein